MSRRERRARPPRRRTRPTLSEARRPLRLAVATVPRWRDGQPSLADDIELIKAGVMYADSVELMGLAASLVHKVCLAEDSSHLSLERYLRITQLVTGEDLSPPPGMTWSDLRQAERLARRPDVDPTLRQSWEGLELLRSGGERHLRATQDAVLRSADAHELRGPYDMGIVSVADLGFGMDYLIEQHTNGWTGHSLQYAQRWADLLAARMSDGRTHLLFDPESGEIAHQLIAEGEVSPSELGMRLAGRAAVGAGFVASLPTMPGAPMDELLSVRKELSDPLDHFRAAVAGFAQQLPQTVGPDLEEAVADLWDTQALPGLTRLQDEFQAHSYPRELSRHFGLSVTDFLGAAPLYVGLGSATGVSDLVAGVTSLAMASSTRVGGDAWRARGAARATASGHDLFYLYQLDRHLRARLNRDRNSRR